MSRRLMVTWFATAMLAFGQGSQLPKYTVATLPAASSLPTYTVQVIDGANAADCVTGLGSINVLCRSTGTAWVPVSPFQSLTTTGSGNATLNLGVLNIPPPASVTLPTFQVNGVNASSQTLQNLENGAGVTVTDLGLGTIQFSASTAGLLAMYNLPPTSGQVIFLSATTESFTDSSGPPGRFTAAGAGVSSSAAYAPFNGGPSITSGVFQAHWSGYDVALANAGISPSQVTAVYAVATVQTSVYNGDNGDNCGSGGTLAVIPGTTRSSSYLLTSITGTNLNTVVCTIGFGVGSSPAGISSVPSIHLAVYYTGTPVTQPNAIQVKYPLWYDAVNNFLTVMQGWPNQFFPTAYANLPSVSSAQAAGGSVWLVSNTDGTGCNGNGSTPEWCYSDGTNWDLYTIGSGGGSVTWPTSGDLVISNGTSSPAGLAEVDGACVLGAGGVWTAGSCGSGGAGTVLSGSGYALPAYGSSASTTVGPSNVTTDSTGSNLIVPGSVATTGTTQGVDVLAVGTGTLRTPRATYYSAWAGPPSGTAAFASQMPTTAPTGPTVYTWTTPTTVNGMSQAAETNFLLQGTDSMIPTFGAAGSTGSLACQDANGGLTTSGCATGGNAGHPTILPPDYTAAGQGSWSLNSASGALFNFEMYNTTHANGDNISFSVDLPAGTYTVQVFYNANNNRAMVDVLFGSTVEGTIDQYASSLTTNQTGRVTGIVLSSGGIQTLTLKADGKNASSSDYYVDILYISIWRTA